MKQVDQFKNRQPLDENGLSECARHYLKHHGQIFQPKESDRALDVKRVRQQQDGLSALLDDD
ncbi:MAG: hypothetical protein WCP01_03765 [Methylococcaceae bacterium]